MSYTAPTVVASGTTFAQFQAGGASGHLAKLITAQGVTAKPSVKASWTATGGGSTTGLLAAGTYYQVITECNGFGETLPGPEGDQITVSAGNIPRVTFQTLKAGNTSRNVYIGAVNGLTGGPYILYAAGITTSTYDMPLAAPTTSSAVAPPTVNTTALSTKALELLRSAKDGNLEDAYRYLRSAVAGFNRGDPAAFPDVLTRLRTVHATFAMLSTLCAEMGTLIAANPGTLGTAATGIGGMKAVRTWA